MRIIVLSTLKSFWEEHPEYLDAKEPTLAWYRHALAADWSAPAAVNLDYRNARGMPAFLKTDAWYSILQGIIFD
jgi:mRNA-degrading endonuclease HigB of HigAB toxin-antitoxin module